MRNVLSLDSSIIYRASLKHFDRQFMKYNLGYASSLFLTLIYENEGITMNEIATNGSFDKGTITKSIQKLADDGYVLIKISEIDKRQKNLYTSDKAHEIIPNIYLARQAWWDYLLEDLNDIELENYLNLNNKIMNKAKEFENIDLNDDVKFFGFQKLTLLDYPSHMASTLFTGGCNFRCPFCQNRSLVFLDEGNVEIDQEEILNFINDRKKLLDGICISGGEPLMHKGIKSFIKKIKDIGLKVKVDTNGSYFETLKELIDENLVDYIAMDIKNSKDSYLKTIGLNNFNLDNIYKSVDLLKENRVDYEFRTTIVKELHSIQDIENIGIWLQGGKRLYLQNFEDSETCIMQGLHSHDLQTLKDMQKILNKYIETHIRGIE